MENRRTKTTQNATKPKGGVLNVATNFATPHFLAFSNIDYESLVLLEAAIGIEPMNKGFAVLK